MITTMIQLKNREQIEAMKIAGRITGEALLKGAELIREGISTKEIDTVVRSYIEKCGARPSFLGYGGFPGSACISLNNQVIHGIPSEHVILKEGDIVKIDVGAFFQGFHGDSANTFGVGRISSEAQRLIDVTKECFYCGIAQIKPNVRFGDVGHAIESWARENGYSVVREFVGHGVGHELHESPDVPNYGIPGRGGRIYTGMTFAVEPMVNQGSAAVRILDDEWTVVTTDGRLSAHYEHTVAVLEDGVCLLTKVD